MTKDEINNIFLNLNQDIENVEEEMYDNPVKNTLRVHYEDREWKITEDGEVMSALAFRDDAVFMHSFRKGKFAMIVIPFPEIRSIYLDVEETDDGFSRVTLNIEDSHDVNVLN